MTKIPRIILAEVIDYFRSDLSKEWCVRINRTANGWEVVKAQYRVQNSGYIEYQFPVARPGTVPICSIHSHNVMPAFFSCIDNRDEVLPGIYGVVGNLDKEVPSMEFRISTGEEFFPISADDLFI